MSTFWLGLTRYDVLRPARFIGFANYVRMFTDDDVFVKSFWNTLYYTAFNVPIGVIGSLLLAMLLNNTLVGMNVYKTIFYIPTITTGVAMAMLWLWIFDPGIGVVNTVLRAVGLTGPLWFRDPDWVKPTMVLVKIVEIGGPQMIIFLAGLQNLPTELYEAADIDGARPWVKFWRITAPLLSPVILYNVVVAVIGSFKVFINAYVITQGGPLNESMFMVLYIYRNAFTFLKMGYASAVASVFFVLILVVTILQLWLSKKWVYYSSAR